jgi:4-amino-4-deoxy-L-arabinose transferase-like glycosyltransferase
MAAPTDDARRFWFPLAAIVAGGVALRVLHVLAIAPSTSVFSDGWYFQQVAQLVADGHGYVNPVDYLFHGRSIPTAAHPPLYTFVLAGARKVGIAGDEAQRSLGCLFGAITIVLVGLLGRRVGGRRVGLVAAALAATYPLLIAADGALMSETVYAPLVAGALLAAYRLVDRPTAARAAVLGLLVGLAALTRAEALLLIALLILPAARLLGERRLRLVAAATLAAVCAVAPWTIRNWTTFDRPVLVSTNDGPTIAGSNCRATYYGDAIGDFRTGCIGPVARAGNEAEDAAAYRRRGTSYAGDHLGRLPVVVAARLGRIWGVYAPTDLGPNAQNRRRAVQDLGLVVSYPLIALAIAGAVSLRRRREPLRILLAPVLLVTITAALTYGGLRLRQAAEPALVVLAAAGAAAAWSRLRDGRSTTNGGL